MPSSRCRLSTVGNIPHFGECCILYSVVSSVFHLNVYVVKINYNIMIILSIVILTLLKNIYTQIKNYQNLISFEYCDHI